MSVEKRQVICGVDFEHQTTSAEGAALMLGKKLNAVTNFLHVDESLLKFHNYYVHAGMVMPPALANVAMSQIKQVQEAKLKQHLSSKLGVNESDSVRIELRIGKAVEEILAAVRNKDCPTELLVLAKKRRNFFSELFLGSVANRVIEHNPASTLVFPDDEKYLGWTPKHITVAVPVGENSTKSVHPAARFGAKLCAVFGARLTLVHVLDAEAAERLRDSGRLDSSLKTELSDLIAVAEGAAERNLEQQKHQLESQGISVTTELRRGAVAEQLTVTANALKSDLLVLGSHSGSSQAKNVLGSVASTLTRSANFPILIVRSEGAASS